MTKEATAVMVLKVLKVEIIMMTAMAEQEALQAEKGIPKVQLQLQLESELLEAGTLRVAPLVPREDHEHPISLHIKTKILKKPSRCFSVEFFSLTMFMESLFANK
eukprot:m.46234 g.46234  ORF g.46234 m.46234 type:complete len:105 (+) comp10349_c0_seq1:1152-1466(+)